MRAQKENKGGSAGCNIQTEFIVHIFLGTSLLYVYEWSGFYMKIKKKKMVVLLPENVVSSLHMKHFKTSLPQSSPNVLNMHIMKQHG